MGWTGDCDRGRQGKEKRDIPAKRNLHEEFSKSDDQRTGGGSKLDKGEVTSPNKNKAGNKDEGEYDLRYGLEQKRENDIGHKLMENQRLKEGTGQRDAGKDKDRGESFLSANYERNGVPSRPGHEGG